MRSWVASLLGLVAVAGCAPSTPAQAPQTTGIAAASTSSPQPSTSGTGTGRSNQDAARGAADAVLALTVKGRAPTTGYGREQFGPTWYDVDGNGCDTRNDVLRTDLSAVVPSEGCEVARGTLLDPYTGQTIRFEYGGTSEVDIDHVVALSDSWQKGAFAWAGGKRVAFANDPLNLLAVEASANRQKSDGDAATWLPPQKSFRCEFVARQVAVKQKYEVWVTAAEQDAMLRVLATCPDQELPGLGAQPTTAANVAAAPTGANADARVPRQDAAAGGADPRYATCAEALANGAGGYRRGRDVEYDWYRDADGDGVVCE